jgi:hypothetical protein
MKMMPPSISTGIRNNSIGEWEEFHSRFNHYLTFTGDKHHWKSPKKRPKETNPGGQYRTSRCKMLKDAKAGCLKTVYLSTKDGFQKFPADLDAI